MVQRTRGAAGRAIAPGRRRLGVLAAVVALTVTGCGPGTPPPGPVPSSSSPNASDSPAPAAPPLEPAGAPRVLASGLDAPWSVVRLPEGPALIGERDTARIMELTPDGDLRVAGTVPGVAPGGEGGLLGLAVRDAELFAYFTAADGNRVVRMPITGTPGALGLGPPTDVLTGIAKAATHNGGRIAFGPDGMLYVTAGDAGRPALAQDPDSLNGKILRLTPDGAVPPDNPTNSPVFSLGHRNPQGIAWDAEGRLWASEFGQNTWDELNLITAGSNYGWPETEGAAQAEGFIDPVLQWSTAEASPSGLAHVDGTLFLAALRGARLWSIPLNADSPGTQPPAAWFTGELGRLRDAVAGPDGTLWVLTNNTDGRGSPRQDDDKLLEISLQPRAAG